MSEDDAHAKFHYLSIVVFCEWISLICAQILLHNPMYAYRFNVPVAISIKISYPEG
jgi:hypothetical protein